MPDDRASITVVRTVAAPVAEVFAAWTDAALLRRWLAPGSCEVVEARADARPGGSYLLTLEDREGNREGWRLCLDKLEALLGHPSTSG
jgi:uncharacterized protein YndB with AHSA1/START domain